MTDISVKEIVDSIKSVASAINNLSRILGSVPGHLLAIEVSLRAIANKKP